MDRTLFFVTGDRTDAADLTQEAFLKLWERWDRIDDIEDIHAYLFTVAMNGSTMAGAIDPRRAHERTQLGLVRDPFDQVEAREDVLVMLRSLTPRQRAALLLLDLYEYSSEDAGNIMGVRASTVRALASQGRTALRTAGGPDA